MERSSGVKVSLLWQHFNMSSEGTEKSVSFSNCQGSALSIPASKKSVSFSGSSEDSLKTASSYRNYEEEARELVRQVIEQSLHILQEDMARSVVEWPTGENFTIEKAEEAINKVVKVIPLCTCIPLISSCYTPELAYRKHMGVLCRLPSS